KNCRKHPDADKLIIADADIGDGIIKTLVTGLIPHYQPEDIEGRIVCSIANLKPKKMVGVEGGVMLLAATNKESGKIQILEPPAGVVPGDRIYPEGHIQLTAPTEAPAEVPKRQFEKVVAGFKIFGEKPTFYGVPLIVAGKGSITAAGIPDESEFH
ncbi:MAG: putative Aminoacyl tRNA synthase complex-interacting multifunctional protein 1, partial [Streblomastix strix]